MRARATTQAALGASGDGDATPGPADTACPDEEHPLHQLLVGLGMASDDVREVLATASALSSLEEADAG